MTLKLVLEEFPREEILEYLKMIQEAPEQYNKGYKDGVNETLDKIWKEIANLNPCDYGPARSIDFYETAKEMQIHVLKIIDTYKESEE